MNRRVVIVFGSLLALITLTGFMQSWSIALSLLTVGLISSVIALGLNIQWGYAGLFNAGVMAFSAIGAIACVLVSMPWVTDVMLAGLASLQTDADKNQQAIDLLQQDIGRRLEAERHLAWAWVIGCATGLLAITVNRILKVLVTPRSRRLLVTAVLGVGLVIFRAIFDPATAVIESTGFGDNSKYLGGLGLPIIIAWIAGGALAALTAWVIGRIALGLRSDYLAIATLGISEIVIALLKNENWLTRGTLNVTGLPSPVPTAKMLQDPPYLFSISSSLIVNSVLFISIIAVFLLLFLWLAHRALHSPWGRMMRAIRDNEETANAMGKDIVMRHRQVFILGCFLLGVGGAMLATHVLQFEPGSYHPLRYTFLVWVMVIVGGSGNNLGSIAGGILIWFAWIQAEPAAAWVFQLVGDGFFLEGSPVRDLLEIRTPQMRTLLMGVILLLVLRFAPRGILPETLQHK
jgi:branched-chain amino acid transport system permease protein